MGQMMSEQWTPNTEGVRMVFSFYPEMDGALKTSQRQAIAEFDRWLAKHDEKVARDAVKAERLRVLGLLENAERMHNLYRTVWWNLSPHPSGTRAARLMTHLLRAELMGPDDE
jgi:hypothetical protein